MGVETLHIKQNREYRLSILNGSTEFLHIIRAFVTLCRKQYGEWQLSVLKNTASVDSLL
jgi:hypothetical protein